MPSKAHAWVEFQYMPVHVETTSDGDVIISADEDAEITAREEARHACYLCEIPLTPETVNTECAGSPA